MASRLLEKLNILFIDSLILLEGATEKEKGREGRRKERERKRERVRERERSSNSHNSQDLDRLKS